MYFPSLVAHAMLYLGLCDGIHGLAGGILERMAHSLLFVYHPGSYELGVDAPGGFVQRAFGL